MDDTLSQFRQKVRSYGSQHYRDLAWRNTYDPYAIWISEVMLQQTQVCRVDGRWQRWLVRFPCVEALACASVAEVLEEWQGLGYNRRALHLKHAAEQIVTRGTFPQTTKELVKLPSIGPATAAGIRAFAFNLPGVYLETNVRTVFLHEFFPDAQQVPDSELIPYIEKTCPQNADDPQDCPKTWYYALLDYGAYLKQVLPNPSRRSKTHTKQKKFEGSHRQKRAEVVRILLAAQGEALNFDEIAQQLNEQELLAKRQAVSSDEIAGILDELVREGFCVEHEEAWRV